VKKLNFDDKQTAVYLLQPKSLLKLIVNLSIVRLL